MAEESKAGPPADTQGSPRLERKDKTPSRFFSFLNCCSSSGVEGDDAILPPIKTVKPPPVTEGQRSRDKTDANAGDTSTAESKEPVYGDEKADSAAASGPSQSQAEGARSDLASQRISQVDGAAALQETDEHASTLAPSTGDHGSQTGSTDAMAIGVEPAKDADLSGKQGPASSGADTTTALAPDDGATEEDMRFSTHQEEATKPIVSLPPPPPILPPPATQAHEPQTWLLPPPLPHLKGRKCLVLDLDETLVHSSFKVLSSPLYLIGDSC